MHTVREKGCQATKGSTQKSCDSGTLNCPKCPHFYTKRKEDLYYHLANYHAPQDKKLSTACTICLKEFPSFYSLQQHKRRKHGRSTKVGTKSSESLKKVPESEELDKNNEKLHWELSVCQHFLNRWKLGVIEYSISNCRNLIPAKLMENWRKCLKSLTAL